MNIAVIIPSKTIGNLTPCVEAVIQNEPTARILLVDDSEGAFPTDIARLAHAKNLDWFRGDKPFVFSKNCNIGIRDAFNPPRSSHGHLMSSEADGVVLLNDDALLQTPGGFTLLAQASAENPDFGIIGAVTNVTGQPEQFPRGIGLREVEHFAFVCVYIPRSTIENPNIGLLDERYCLDYGCEDRDYCEAVKAAGLKVGVHDGCFVDHQSLTSTFRGEPHAPLSFARNFELLKAKWGDRLNA